MALSMRSGRSRFHDDPKYPWAEGDRQRGAGQRSTSADRRGPARPLPPPTLFETLALHKAALGLGAAVRCTRALAGREVANLRRRRARLGVSIEAVRQRAFSNKWARMLGTTDVCAPDLADPTQIPVIRPSDQALVDALKPMRPSLASRRELRAQTGPRTEH
jgi:hypothetical protein